MAFSTDTSLNFNSSVGYTFDPAAVEFVTATGGTGARLKAAAVTTSNIDCPEIDTSGWTGGIHKIVVDSRDSVSGTSVYLTRLFISFDGGVSFGVFESGAWRKAEPQDLGMTRMEIEAVRVWPALSTIDGLVVRVALTRETTTGAGGLINQITIYYGADALTLDGGEPAWSGQTLIATNSATNYRMPSVVPPVEIIRPADLHRSLGGYKAGINRATNERRGFKGIEWRFVNEAERDWLTGFIYTHRGASFKWTVPGKASTAYWITAGTFDAPRVDADPSGGSAGLFTVKADFMEVFPS